MRAMQQGRGPVKGDKKDGGGSAEVTESNIPKIRPVFVDEKKSAGTPK
jgi:hypothetical protein